MMTFGRRHRVLKTGLSWRAACAACCRTIPTPDWTTAMVSLEKHALEHVKYEEIVLPTRS